MFALLVALLSPPALPTLPGPVTTMEYFRNADRTAFNYKDWECVEFFDKILADIDAKAQLMPFKPWAEYLTSLRAPAKASPCGKYLSAP